jgi:hypothetical protein
VLTSSGASSERRQGSFGRYGETQQNSSEKAQLFAGPVCEHEAFALYAQCPRAWLHGASVSSGGAPQEPAWHLPPRQRPKPPAHGQPHAPADVLAANAAARSARYRASADLLTATVVQPSHAVAGHWRTSPTETQSLSAAHVWS